MDRKKRFELIARDIKSVKIQGARNIARQALKAYEMFPDKKHKTLLMSLRPTEPMLQNVLEMADSVPESTLLEHFDYAQDVINLEVMKLIKNYSKIFTHCHSTNVTNALVYAKKHGKKFEVFLSQTQPLYQGRKTAKELSRAGIKTTLITDLEIREFIRNTEAVFIGADALLKNGDVINKIGSAMVAELASDHKIPLYIVADSWKFTKNDVKIEERAYQEVWKYAPKSIKIRNLAFEKVPSEYIKAIISELGILKPKEFVKRVRI